MKEEIQMTFYLRKDHHSYLNISFCQLFKENLLANSPPFYRVIIQNITALSDGHSSKFTALELVSRV